MIRINLLPIKAARRAQMGRRQLVFFLVSIVAAVGLVTILHTRFVAKDTGDVETQISKVQRQTKTVIAKTGNVTHYERLKRKYRKRRKAYRRVLAGCYCRCSGDKKLVSCTSRCGPTQRMERFCPGPVLVMRELSRALSEKWGPTLKSGLDPTRRLDYYNPNWNPTGVWVLGWEEKQGQVHIVGGAKANGDVAEFERRLKVSRYFLSVRVDRSALTTDQNRKMNYYQFEVTAKVAY
ncbi:MAG: PilN domain-containing protein [Deltaproteobacteria bacterium]|nr:PilN domain-containing protein [Deltaproteobacteria bacterium]